MAPRRGSRAAPNPRVSVARRTTRALRMIPGASAYRPIMLFPRGKLSLLSALFFMTCRYPKVTLAAPRAPDSRLLAKGFEMPR
jgi:hypothetical protein